MIIVCRNEFSEVISKKRGKNWGKKRGEKWGKKRGEKWGKKRGEKWGKNTIIGNKKIPNLLIVMDL